MCKIYKYIPNENVVSLQPPAPPPSALQVST